MKPIIDIPNSDMPVADTIRQALTKLTSEEKNEILGKMNERDFVDHRVDVYLTELERAFHSGNYAPGGAEEVALSECLGGLSNR